MVNRYISANSQANAENSPIPIPEGDALVLQEMERCRTEAEDAKKERLTKGKNNRDIFLGRHDWSYKQEGQTMETLPKVPVSIEQMCAFIKRGLVQFGDWFSIDLDRTVAQKVDSNQIREVLKCFLNDLWDRNNKSQKFPTVISDAVKVALMESLIILKVHGGMMSFRKPKFLPASPATKSDDELAWEEKKVWRLRIDIVRPEDYFPDPTGNGLYEIHRCERDLHEIISAAEDGLYDMEAVNKLKGVSMTQPLDEKRTDRDRNQTEATPPSFRKKVLLEEFWGTLLNPDGTVLHRNIVCTRANNNILIRKPEPNPFWHQESPFVVTPLIRVPFSVWHKALYDDASPLAIAINEVFSLIMDGGIASVWGIKQVRVEDLEDPSQIAGGIPQGATVAVKQTLPHNADAIKVVATGQVPNDAMAMYEALNREYYQATLSNELKAGFMPPKGVVATGVVEASQSQAVTLDGLVADLEDTGIEPVLRKAWLTILQNADDIPNNTWSSTLSAKVALILMRASPEERYALFANKFQFRAFGLSATMQRALDFQKMMALQQAIAGNPMLMQAFMQKYSPDKALQFLMRALNLNPTNMEMDATEEQGAGDRMQQVAQIAQLFGGGGRGRGASAPGPSNPDGAPAGGGSELPAQINQLQNPVTGFPPNG